jgi:hypothetical protein
MHVNEEENSCMSMYSVHTKKKTFDNLYQQDGVEVAGARLPALGSFFLFHFLFIPAGYGVEVAGARLPALGSLAPRGLC